MYNTNLLNSASECDALLNKMATEQDDLSFRKQLIQRRVAAETRSAADLQADIAATQAELDSVTNTLASMPDGDAKVAMTLKQKRLDTHLYAITHRRNGTTAEAVLDRELEVSKLDKELEAIGIFVAEVETRKSQF